MNVVITGTSSGLGKELAQRFHEEGHCVFGSCVSNEDEHATQPVLDLGVENSIIAYSKLVKKRMGDKVDLLINNAGINAICRFEMLDVTFVNRIMDVNFLGPVMLTRNLLNSLRGGTVVNVISDAAWRPMRHSLAYNCSKAALDMATKQMARELTKPYDIAFVGVRPGKMANTGMSNYIDQMVCELRGWTPEQSKEYAAANSVTGQETPPKHVAGLIYNLAMSGSFKFMSGACMDLAG